MAASSLDPAQTVLPEPPWNDLRIFLAVVAHGSLNGAARALRVSQPTIARRMRALEDTLGVPLLLRGANQVRLTDAGRAVLETASPMAEAAAAVPRSAAAYRPDPHAPVRITVTASVTMFLSLHARALARSAAPAQVAFCRRGGGSTSPPARPTSRCACAGCRTGPTSWVGAWDGLRSLCTAIATTALTR